MIFSQVGCTFLTMSPISFFCSPRMWRWWCSFSSISFFSFLCRPSLRAIVLLSSHVPSGWPHTSAQLPSNLPSPRGRTSHSSYPRLTPASSLLFSNPRLTYWFSSATFFLLPKRKHGSVCHNLSFIGTTQTPGFFTQTLQFPSNL